MYLPVLSSWRSAKRITPMLHKCQHESCANAYMYYTQYSKVILDPKKTNIYGIPDNLTATCIYI